MKVFDWSTIIPCEEHFGSRSHYLEPGPTGIVILIEYTDDTWVTWLIRKLKIFFRRPVEVFRADLAKCGRCGLQAYAGAGDSLKAKWKPDFHLSEIPRWGALGVTKPKRFERV